jgi:hypothetical protein
MNEHADQLREAFVAHEHLAPDAATVYARAQELARTYRRRRVGAQAAGGAVLGAGLVAGGIALPSVLPGGPQTKVIVQSPASGAAPTAPPTTPPTQAELEKDWDAYFAAGYDLDAAEKLAQIWGLSSQPSDLGAVKAEAGRRLLAGETLPVEPNPQEVVDAKEAAAVAKFFNAGYDYADAVKLSELWKTANPYEAKVLAGEKLLDGERLPIKP